MVNSIFNCIFVLLWKRKIGNRVYQTDTSHRLFVEKMLLEWLSPKKYIQENKKPPTNNRRLCFFLVIGGIHPQSFSLI